MDSGKRGGSWLIPIVATLLVPPLLCLGLFLFLSRSPRALTIPLSVGMATPVPGQVVAQAVPTQAPPQPQPTVGPAVPTLPPPTQPTAVVVQPGNNTGDGTTVEPQPVDGNTPTDGNTASSSSGSVEPFPVDGSGGGGSSSGSAGGSSGGSGVACNRRIVHVVRAGENLFRIALRYNTTSTAIQRLNGITDVRALRVGQRLTIITCRGGSSGGYGTYVVQPGDNLFRIALRFGTSVAALRSANGLRSNIISVGQVLRIP